MRPPMSCNPRVAWPHRGRRAPAFVSRAQGRWTSAGATRRYAHGRVPARGPLAKNRPQIGYRCADRVVAVGRSTGVEGLPASDDWNTWDAGEMQAAVDHLRRKRGLTR